MRGIEKFAAGLFFGTLAVSAWLGVVCATGLSTGSWRWSLPELVQAGRHGQLTMGPVFWVVMVLGIILAVVMMLGLRAWDQNHGGGGGQQKTRTRREAEAHKVKFPEVRAQLSKKQALQRGRETLKATQAPVSTDPKENAAAAQAFAESLPDDQLVTRIGKLGGKDLWAQSEDSKGVLAPPREGKTNYLAVELVRDAPGPVLATSTKADLLMITGVGRQAKGRVWVLDMEAMTGWPDQVRWNPVAGCDDVEVAIRRGQAWAGAQPMNGVKGGDWFNSKAGAVLGRLLHVAAISGKSMRDVVTWSNNLQSKEPQNLLHQHGEIAAPGVLEYLEGVANSRAGETTDSIQQTLSGLLEPLAAPRVLEQLSPPPGQEFDIHRFLTSEADSLVLVCDEQIGLDTAPLVSMFANEVLSEARRISQAERGGRFWPAVRFVLDEAPNLAAFPKMPSIVADSGGRGIEVFWFAQAESQLVDRWGENGAKTILASTNVRYYLPGLDLETVKPLSEQMGTFDRKRTSMTRQADGSVSRSQQDEERPVMRPEEIQQLPSRSAIVRYRNLRPMHLQLTPWWERPDAEQIKKEQLEAAQMCGKLPGASRARVIR